LLKMVSGPAISDGLRGQLKHDEPMSRHTAWGIGGLAKAFYAPADLDDLVVFIRSQAPAAAFFWLGLGSNILVRDGGLNCTVIHTAATTDDIERNGDVVRVGAGVACPKVARYCARQGLIGLEFFAGIPGTVGGALAMNAGAFGGETWALVKRVSCVDGTGQVRTRDRDEFDAGYRTLRQPAEEWFVEAEFQLKRGSSDEGSAKVKGLLARRASTQPTGQRSCGSVFRNPPGDFAARLIESSGLKGVRIGGAEVSTKHANFIVNTGGATATDVEILIEEIQAKVLALTGVKLMREVVIVGEVAKEVG